jgi:ankyrin repeat protein
MDSRRADDQRHGRQENDYQNPTVGDHGRAVFGNIYGNNCSMSILVPERPEKTDQEKKEDFMKGLRFDVMESRLATIGIAHRDTCSWLYTRAEYLRWQDPENRAEHHGFLWIKGKPGAGKSTLMKHALQHAQSLDQSDTKIVSFFFNARGHELEKTTEGMYRSLLHQVYGAIPDRLPEILSSDSTESKEGVWQLPILQNMLREALLNFGNTTQFICYIDALDECDEDAIRLAIEYFEDLGELAISQDVKIFICFASRHYPNITMQRYQALDLDAQSDHQEDIQKFVKGKLRGTGEIHSELSGEISRRSSGVFLWATLVVRILNKSVDHGATRTQLLADLGAVPTGIEELLRSILLDGGDFILPALLWVLFSFRPLSASALCLAIKSGAGCLTPKDLDQSETTLEQMQLFILNSSKGLVEFSKGRYPDAQFIHETVREYVLNGGLSILEDDLAENPEAKSHFRLATWCRTLIELEPPRGLQYSEIRILDYALEYLYSHCEYAFEGGALKLDFLDAIPQSTQSRVLRLDGASSFLGMLLQDGKECLAEGLLRRQLRRSREVHAYDTARGDAIERSIPYLDVNSICDAETDSTPLLLAIRSNHREPDGPDLHKLVQLLIECGANPNPERGIDSPLLAAVENDENYATVELLLHHGANPNLVQTRGTQTITPLTAALVYSSVRCVEILLQGGADANGCGAEREGPLIIAVQRGQQDVVRMLLEHGADANGCGAKFGEPLAHAMSRNLQDIVRLLLAHGANPNGSSRHRPLHLAFGPRDEGVVMRWAGVCYRYDAWEESFRREGV